MQAKQQKRNRSRPQQHIQSSIEDSDSGEIDLFKDLMQKQKTTGRATTANTRNKKQARSGAEGGSLNRQKTAVGQSVGKNDDSLVQSMLKNY